MAEEAYRTMFTTKALLFSRLILHKTLNEKKLAIPKWFVKQYGARLRDSVLLMLPNGVEWRLKLSRSSNMLWFEDGWQKFAEFYSLKLGYFLIFQYLGDSSFLVVIFSCTASEIRYPTPPVEIMDDGEGEEEEVHSSASAVQIQKGKRKIRNPPKRLGGEKSATAIARAEAAFKTDKPFFMLAMTPSSVDSSLRAPRPLSADIFKKFFKQDKGEAVLGLADERTWTVGYHRHAKNAKWRGAFRFNTWHKFAKDANLRVGDVCAFELVESTEPRFKVTIIRHPGQGAFEEEGES